jgi:hypothetical protein
MPSELGWGLLKEIIREHLSGSALSSFARLALAVDRGFAETLAGISAAENGMQVNPTTGKHADYLEIYAADVEAGDLPPVRRCVHRESLEVGWVERAGPLLCRAATVRSLGDS